MGRNHIPSKSERKQLRKRIRKRLWLYALRDFARDSRRYLFDNYLYHFFWKKRLRRVIEGSISRRSVHFLRGAGIVYDYTPESLSKIDEVIAQWREEMSSDPMFSEGSKAFRAFVEAEGSYLGEVITKRIGGEWVFPYRWKLWLSRAQRDSTIFYDDWVVLLNDQRIPVMKISMCCWKGDEQAPTLRGAYDRIESTGRWP